MTRTIVVLILMATSTFSCSNMQKNHGNEPRDLRAMFDRYYEDRLHFYPTEATQIADNRFNDTLVIDISESTRQLLRNFYKQYLDSVSSFDRSKLSKEDQLSYDVFKREMQMQIEGLAFTDHLMPINQFSSIHLSFAQLGSGSGNQPFKTVKDYSDFVKRIGDFSQYIDTAISNMRRGMVMGIVPPAILMQRVLPQLKDFIVDDATKSVFYFPVKNIPATFKSSEKDSITRQYIKAINEDIIPSYKKLYNFISEEYIQKCRKTAGISEIPGGKEYYAYLVKFWTTTELSPDEIYNIGQREVKRLRNEMEKVKNETGFTGDLKSFFHYIHTDKKFMPFKKDEEVIAAYNDIHKKMQPQLDRLFNLVPKTPFEVRQTEKFREASASAEYREGAPDGSRPGIFYVPVIDASKFYIVEMEDLFLHEAIPGHHYQVSLQQENDSLPKFRRFGWYGAYGEGWALYCESLGKELGLYTDPYKYFGSLSEEMHRAIRLVVDVGMHVKGMTREEAIQFSLENDAESEADNTAEVERYMSLPGQALAYKIGQMKILELREKLKNKLGSDFDIKAFHDAVLKDGCLPLDVFEKKLLEDQKK